MRLPPSRLVPPLDPGFCPAFLWNRACQTLVAEDRTLVIALVRDDGTVFRHESRILGAGAPKTVRRLAAIYSHNGARAFDHSFIGSNVYGQPLIIEDTPLADLPPERSAGMPIGRTPRRLPHRLRSRRQRPQGRNVDRRPGRLLRGNPLGALLSGRPRLPPRRRARLAGARRRPPAPRRRQRRQRGGCYVDNEVRGASRFRSVPPDQCNAHIRRMFFTLQTCWKGVPFEVANDGEVTALAGSMSPGDNAVLGISMGTSLAAGYVTPEGSVTPWLNELAFAPIDHRPDAPRDEWRATSAAACNTSRNKASPASPTSRAFPARPICPRPNALSKC